jgi:hypothetical protein
VTIGAIFIDDKLEREREIEFSRCSLLSSSDQKDLLYVLSRIREREREREREAVKRFSVENFFSYRLHYVFGTLC